MTTYTPFVADPSAAFTFNPTLDGVSYTAQVRWNLFGQRWYLFLTDASGDVIVNTPLVGSPDGFDIDLTFGLFVTSTLVFRDTTQQFEVTP